MTVFNSPQLAPSDEINDDIWVHHLMTDASAIEMLNPRRFDSQLIKQEISKGCSPVPDILSEGFGAKPSLMFVSTVYGFVNKYLNVMFDRKHEAWDRFSSLFYQNIIKSNVGIYGRLNDIYDVLSSLNEHAMDFCFTELVKTVLISPRNTVSNLDTGDNFLRYFLKHEFPFLKRRLAMITGHCVVFTFTDLSTFFTISALGNVDVYETSRLPEEIQIVYQASSSPLKFATKLNRTGRMEIVLEAGGTFSSSVALQTVFKTKDRDIYIVPLPHPSGANNGTWAHLGDWRSALSQMLQVTRE